MFMIAMCQIGRENIKKYGANAFPNKLKFIA